MRVVEPKQFSPLKATKRSKRKYIRLVGSFGLFALLAGSFVYFSRTEDSQTVQSSEPAAVESATTTPPAPVEPPIVIDTLKDTLRTFADNEFKIFYDNLRQPNLQPVENPPTISGNDIADARIRQIAEQRGYKLRSSPETGLSTIGDQKLQSPVIDPWQKLQSSAKNAGFSLSLVSGYRSEDTQRQLFLQRLGAAGGTVEDVAAGTADSIVNQILITTSIPGYSKHHTGYTLDLQCGGYAFENFKNSPCNDWLSADNFKVAKEHGFIPSYPPLADAQGPDPEAWEYVWVGTDLLYE